MKPVNNNINNELFTELTEEETAALNGGRFCRWVFVWRRVCFWYGCFFQRAWAVQCF